MDSNSFKNMKIGVLLGGRSSERTISLKSGGAVLESLARSGYDAVAIDARERLVEKLKKEKVGAAFIVLHGRWGEDGTVQGLLEIMGIPYTGPGVLGSSAAMDKAVMKYILQATGIPTPAYVIAGEGERIALKPPFVVKPANEGSTIGISLVHKTKDVPAAMDLALKYDRKIVVEEFVSGQEITVAVINGRALPVIEVRPLSGFYDFESKYTRGKTEYIVPAKISRHVAKKAQAIAMDVYRSFGLSGCVRTDMLIRDGIPLVIDINTSPGMTETSLVPKAWAHEGRTFDELIEEILTGASLKT
ncbi:MAG: D-alanine--D-alanine ligase [Syntrophorhabdaceae bacterium]|nr:D-alanine--D-alanine ligase [Syntrophorhabdaceae bacterium]